MSPLLILVPNANEYLTLFMPHWTLLISHPINTPFDHLLIDGGPEFN